MPTLAQAAETLTTLARSHAAGDRERLLQALATLCDASGASARPQTQALLADLLSALLAQADPEQRTRFADRLAPAAWTPAAVALQLAREPLSAEALADLVERAGTSPGLRVSLARRPGLTPELARALLPYVAEPLRQELAGRFGLALSAAPPHQPSAADEAALVGKLQAAGRLGPGALLRFLRDGRRHAFSAGVAALSGTPASDVHAAFTAEAPDELEQLCLHAGLDRAVMPEVVALARDAET